MPFRSARTIAAHSRSDYTKRYAALLTAQPQKTSTLACPLEDATGLSILKDLVLRGFNLDLAEDAIQQVIPGARQKIEPTDLSLLEILLGK